jgi:hypothetical protein
MFFFTLPRFQDFLLTNPTNKTTRWIIGTVKNLREQAQRDRKRYGLRISMGSNKMWIINESMSEEELQSAAQNGYTLPDDVRLLDVEFPKKGKISVGEAEISFYGRGYSDKALIHLENDDAVSLTCVIEPFLPTIALHETYVTFEE